MVSDGVISGLEDGDDRSPMPRWAEEVATDPTGDGEESDPQAEHEATPNVFRVREGTARGEAPAIRVAT